MADLFKGKSVIASLIIDRVRDLQNVSAAFFYFTHGDPEKNSFVPMARAILTQLLAQDASLVLLLEQKMSISSGQAVLSSRELAKELLTTALQSRKTYVVLDGIDECERNPRKDVCGWFRSLADSLPAAKQDEIRCLFISQDDGFARKDLSMLPTLSITVDQIREDISSYACHLQERIEERFGPLGNHGLALADIVPGRSKGKLKQVCLSRSSSQRLIPYAVGMFIFAKCVLAELYQQPSKEELVREWGAESFPTELEEV